MANTGGTYLLNSGNATLPNSFILKSGTNVTLGSDATAVYVNAITGGGASSSQPAFPGNLPMSSVKFVNLNTTGLIASAATIYDLYTVPNGKRTIFFGVSYLNDNISSGTPGRPIVLVKTNGLYYPISNTGGTGPGNASQTNTVDFIGDPGEIFAVNLSGYGSTASVTLKCIEMDTSVNIRSAKLYSIVSGNNTMFTSVNSSTALGLPAGLTLTGQASIIPYVNMMSGSNIVRIYVVPSGQAVTNKYLIVSSSNTGSDSKTSYSGNFSLTSGQTLVLFSGTGATQQFAWWNYQEL